MAEHPEGLGHGSAGGPSLGPVVSSVASSVAPNAVVFASAGLVTKGQNNRRTIASANPATNNEVIGHLWWTVK